MVALNLRTWREHCRLRAVEPPGVFKIIRPDSTDELKAFAELCHDLVLDRPTSFTLKDRIKLYKRWLASKQPCLVAAEDGRGQIIAASIILPLATAASHEFWLGELDALDIGSEHIDATATGQKHLLVDMLARNRDYIRKTQVLSQPSLYGIGFRAAIYHLSLFHASGQALDPVLLCSTFNRDLSALLHAAGFERRIGQGELAAPIFRADLAQRNPFPKDALDIFDDATHAIETYLARSKASSQAG